MAALEAATSSGASEEELIERVVLGDKAAFGFLYERYFPRIYQFIGNRLRNRADTEETVQEIFINVYTALPSYRREAPFAAWVFGITRRTLANRFKKKRHPTVPLGEDEPRRLGLQGPAQSCAPNPHEMYEFEERLVQLDRTATTKLSDEQRHLVRLHYMQNRSIQEIARHLRKSENAVNSNLYRARKLLLAR